MQFLGVQSNSKKNHRMDNNIGLNKKKININITSCVFFYMCHKKKKNILYAGKFSLKVDS